MRPNHLLRCAARWLLAAGAACSMAGAHAGVTGISGSQAGTTRSFDLFAEEGYLSMADGVQVYSWGYGAPETTTNGTGRMQVSGPTLLVNQGETVTVNFTNRLPARSSILPGRRKVRVRSVSCRLLSLPTRPTIRRASILRWLCTQMGRWTKPWTNCSTCSAATGSGTMVPPRPSFSPSSKR